MDFRRRLELAVAELERRLAGLPATKWRIEPYPLTGERRNSLLLLGETGVFVISATYAPGHWDDVIAASKLARKVQLLLPGYPGQVQPAICHPFSSSQPRLQDLVLAHPHTGRPLDRVRLLLHFKAALQRADVRPVRLHDLRHTFATTVAASGQVSLRTLQEWMGHRDLKTTQIYADYMPGEREAELIDAAFGGQLVANSFNTAQPDPLETPVNTDDLRGPT